MKRTIMHLEVGDENWTPTPKELLAITNKFKRAVRNTKPSDTAVVTTRAGVKVRVIEFDPDYVSLSGYAAPLMMTNQANPADLHNHGFPFTYTTTGHKP